MHCSPPAQSFFACVLRWLQKAIATDPVYNCNPNVACGRLIPARQRHSALVNRDLTTMDRKNKRHSPHNGTLSGVEAPSVCSHSPLDTGPHLLLTTPNCWVRLTSRQSNLCETPPTAGPSIIHGWRSQARAPRVESIAGGDGILPTAYGTIWVPETGYIARQKLNAALMGRCWMSGGENAVDFGLEQQPLWPTGLRSGLVRLACGIWALTWYVVYRQSRKTECVLAASLPGK